MATVAYSNVVAMVTNKTNFQVRIPHIKNDAIATASAKQGIRDEGMENYVTEPAEIKRQGDFCGNKQILKIKSKPLPVLYSALEPRLLYWVVVLTWIVSGVSHSIRHDSWIMQVKFVQPILTV